VVFHLANASPGYTPTPKGSWDDTSHAVYKRLSHTGPVGASATVTVTETTATNNWSELAYVFVSDPITVAGNVTGSYTLNYGASESSASANCVTYTHMWVTQGNSDTVRGTVIANRIGGTEFPTTASGRNVGASMDATVAAQVGDRIVLEIGTEFQNAVTTSFSATFYYGSTGGTNLGSGDTNVTTRPSKIDMTSVDPLFVPAGTGSGGWTFAGAAAGKATKTGTATGSWSLAGVAAGSKPAKGSGTGGWAFTGAAVGASPVPNGAGTGAWGFTGAAVGASELSVVHAAAQSGNGSSIAVTTDAALLDGDLRIIFATVSGQTVTAGTTGWTEAYNQTVAGGTRRLYIWTRTHNEADPAVSLTLSAAANYGVTQIALRGHNGLDVTPVVASSGTAATALPAPSAVTTVRGGRLVCFYSSINNATSNTLGAAYNMANHAAQTGNNSVGHSVMLASEARHYTGRVGTNQATSGASAAWVAATVVVAPIIPTAAPARPYLGDADWLWEPIKTNPAVDGQTAAIVANLSTGSHACSLEDFATKLVLPDEISSGTPRYDITFLNQTGNGGEDWGSDPFGSDTMPIPDGTENQIPPGDGIVDPDGHVSVGDDTNNTIYSLWQATASGSPNRVRGATWGAKTDLDGAGREVGGGSSTGARITRFGTVVRAAEIASGQINHALAFGTNMARQTEYRYPAAGTDGVNMSSASSTIPEGARIQLDPSINLDAISGITEAELIIGKALQTYGAYCVDQAGVRAAFVFEYSPGHVAYTQAGLSDYLDLTHIPWSDLRVLANWDGTGGSASGSWSFTGAAAGLTEHRGTATGNW
jgi:hypothetical protein